MASKLRLRNVFKIFGNAPQRALKRLKAGVDKETILNETGQTVGVQDASFDVEEGQIFVVMGLSGSGKSTMVRMLNGLITPTSGSITIDGEDVANCSKAALRRIRRDKIAMVFQHFALFPHKTILDNAAYGLKVKGVPLAERHDYARRALDQVGPLDRPVAVAHSMGGLLLPAIGAAFGARRSIGYMLGHNLGMVGVMAVTASGVVGLLLALPGATPVVIGQSSAYFAYLALRIATAPPLVEAAAQRQQPTFLGGFGLSLVNPKGYAAMAALFSGFVLIQGRIDLDVAAKIAVLAIIIAAVNIAWLLMGAAVTRYFREPRSNRIINVAFAVLLIASVGVALLF